MSLSSRERRVWCVLGALLVGAVCLAGLTRVSFWEPHELAIVQGEAESTAPFVRRASSLGFALFGKTVLGGRIMFALTALLSAALAFGWARALVGRRAAWLTAFFTACAPALVLGARQLSPMVGGVFGQLAIIAGGSLVLLGHRPVHRPAGAALAVAGTFFSYGAAGAVVGVAVPLLSLAVAALMTRRAVLATVAGVLGLAAIGAGVSGLLWLGPTWPAAPREFYWDRTIEPLAYGMFPWVAVAPAALAHALATTGERDQAFTGWLVFTWSTSALIAGMVATIVIGPTPFLAIPAVALAVAMGTESSSTSCGANTSKSSQSSPSRLPIGSVVLALLVVALLARDLIAFPERMTWLLLPANNAEAPTVGFARYALLAAGVTFVAALAAPVRWRHIGAAASCAVVALVLALLWLPRVTRDLSSRHLFSSYRALRQPADQLVVRGVPASAVALHDSSARSVARDAEVIDAMAGGPGVFALVPRSSVCAILQGTRERGGDVHTVGGNERFALLASHQRSGDPEVDGLEDEILRAPPAPQIALAARLADGIEIVGVDLPRSVRRGSDFTMTLYYRVTGRARRTWKIFVHFDGPRPRFQGDHDPLAEQCPTSRWRPGDYIVDRFTVTAGTLMQPSGRYRVWAGFFVGGNGTWTNMKVLSGEADEADRVAVGVLEVR